MGKSSDIAAVLREELTAARCLAGTPVMPVRELAGRFAISSVTANKALNILAEEGFIFRVPGKGSYVKNDPPKIFRIGLAIGLQQPLHFNPNNAMRGRNLFGPYVLSEIERYNCIAEHVTYRELVEAKSGDERMAKLDGLLLSRAYIDDKTAPVLRNFSGKIVCLSHECRQDTVNSSQVYVDWHSGLRQALRTLSPEKATHIYIVHAAHDSARIRSAAAVAMLAEHGLKPSAVLECTVCVGDSGEQAGREIFAPYAATASGSLVISCSDYISFGIIEALHTHNLKCGRDLSLLSMDNVEEYQILPYGKPFLSAIDGAMPRCSQEAVRLLLRLLQNNEDCLQHVIVPTTYIPRQSTLITRI